MKIILLEIKQLKIFYKEILKHLLIKLKKLQLIDKEIVDVIVENLTVLKNIVNVIKEDFNVGNFVNVIIVKIFHKSLITVNIQ